MSSIRGIVYRKRYFIIPSNELLISAISRPFVLDAPSQKCAHYRDYMVGKLLKGIEIKLR